MLKITHLVKNFGSRAVLQGLNLDLQPGEVYGLLGPNGAGKTTLINILCGLLQADRGTLTLNGNALGSANRGLIGVAPQENLLYRSLTCAENLDFFAQIYGLNRTERRNQVAQCLAQVNLTDRAHSPVESLSGGMQRRLNMAVALVHQPKLVILDEPTTGLDIEARYELWELIRQLQQSGVTILLTTHLLDEVERLCGRIGILKAGQIIVEGSLGDLCQRINAVEVATIKSSAEDQLLARAQVLGFTSRRYGGELALWLPQVWTLTEILNCFPGIPIESITRQPVRLEHVYLEITTASEGL